MKCGNTLINYLLTNWRSWALLEKLPIVQLLKNFPAFYRVWRFITVFTRALHLSLSWDTSIQSIPYYSITLGSILILSTHHHLGLPSGLFTSGFPTNILYAFFFSPFVLHALPIFVTFCNKLIFYGDELWAPRPTPEAGGPLPFSAVRDCLFNIFTATLHIWRPSPPSATWGRAMPWWQGTHLTWIINVMFP
jgi:hypothetical protein